MLVQLLAFPILVLEPFCIIYMTQSGQWESNFDELSIFVCAATLKLLVWLPGCDSWRLWQNCLGRKRDDHSKDSMVSRSCCNKTLLLWPSALCSNLALLSQLHAYKWVTATQVQLSFIVTLVLQFLLIHLIQNKRPTRPHFSSAALAVLGFCLWLLETWHHEPGYRANGLALQGITAVLQALMLVLLFVACSHQSLRSLSVSNRLRRFVWIEFKCAVPLFIAYASVAFGYLRYDPVPSLRSRRQWLIAGIFVAAQLGNYLLWMKIGLLRLSLYKSTAILATALLEWHYHGYRLSRTMVLLGFEFMLSIYLYDHHKQVAAPMKTNVPIAFPDELAVYGHNNHDSHLTATSRKKRAFRKFEDEEEDGFPPPHPAALGMGKGEEGWRL